MAAAARRSGTRSPLASTLKRGSAVSAISCAIATARARTSVAFRDCDRAAEYTGAGAVAAFLAVGVLEAARAVVAFAVVLARGLVVVAAASAETAPIPTRLTSAIGAQSSSFLFKRTTPV